MARDAHHLGIGVAGEAAGVVDDVLQRLARLYLVVHRALHVAFHLNQLLVRRDAHHVALLQADVARLLAAEQVIVDVDRSHAFAVAEHLYVAQRTDVVDAAGVVEGVEDRGKGREGESSRRGHLAHDVHLYGAHLPQLQRSVGTRVGQASVFAREFVLDYLIGLLYGVAAEVDGAELRHHYGAFGGDGLAYVLLILSPDVDDDLVAGAEAVVLRGGDVHPRGEGQGVLVEDVVAVYSTFGSPFVFDVDWLPVVVVGIVILLVFLWVGGAGSAGLYRGFPAPVAVGPLVVRGTLSACVVDVGLPGSGSGGGVAVLLAFILALHALHLLGSDAARHQLAAYHLLALACARSRLDVGKNLHVGHPGLKAQRHHYGHQGQKSLISHRFDT